MNKWGAISICVFSLAVVIACIDNKTTREVEQTAIQGTLTEAEELPYQLVSNLDTFNYSIQLDYKLEKNAKDHTQKDITKIVFSYPIIDTLPQQNAVLDSIRDRIETLLLQDGIGQKSAKDLEARMTQFMEEYKEHKKEMEEFDLPSGNWVFEMTIDVLLNTPTLMSLKIHKLEFTGGAHANTWTSYLNLNLKTGEVLSLDDLFLENYQTELLAISEAAFKQKVNLDADTNLIETHYEFNAGDFMLPPNFSIGSTGLHFHYNPYDLGPFALGAISFKIPYQKIRSIINTNILELEPIKYKATSPKKESSLEFN
ncbi:DUF3298 and DUF4163 domain-containing protein [Aureispira anguillae]|uniref:DUF3298 and DUF4163 domain-containing protein n=1 Tax=Aureispira anguillae TaxID=2864201 RepID=A0A915YH73_9BACT|nr:DUF3298 and DUF4163 domain-containing protein [Aureispira anguillae]BDS12916.1 DUF3298 and DUF4163 domain-containing protein [Aureispira anguillae]